MQTIFPTAQDIDTAYLLLRDWTRRHFPLVPYKRLLTTASEVDEVHGEIPETYKEWAEPIDLRSFVNPTVITQPMTKFGVEDMRKCTLLISTPDLIDSGLATMTPVYNSEGVKIDFNFELLAAIGDRFTYTGKDYSVISCVPAARWANTDCILYYQFESELYRDTSDKYTT